MAKKRKQRLEEATGVVVYVFTVDAETGTILRMYQQVPADLGAIQNLQPVVSVDIALSAHLGSPGPQVLVTGPQVIPPSAQSRQIRGGGVRRGGRRGPGQAPKI